MREFRVGDRLEFHGKHGKVIFARVANVYPNGECRWVETTPAGEYKFELPLYVVREYLAGLGDELTKERSTTAQLRNSILEK